MNFVATGPVTPPLASGPWHSTQNVPKRARPRAIDSGDAFTGFGTFAATSRCSLGITASAPRGTTPAHGEHALARHDTRRLRHVVDPAVRDDRAHEAGGAADAQDHEEEDVLHPRTP